MLPLSLVSLYPPRRDATPCQRDADPYPACGSRACNDYVDVAGYGGRHRVSGLRHHVGRDASEGLGIRGGRAPRHARHRRRHDGDARRPIRRQTVMFSIPDDWAPGDYVAWLEVNTEGDYNGTFNDTTFPTPARRRLGFVGDGHRLPLSRPAVGRVQRAVHARGLRHLADHGSRRLRLCRRARAGRGADAHDGRFDHRRSRQLAGKRRRSASHAAGGDLPVEGRGSGSGLLQVSHAPPAAPTEMTAAPVADSKHSHQWGHLHFIVPASDAADRQVRRPHQHGPDRRRGSGRRSSRGSPRRRRRPRPRR